MDDRLKTLAEKWLQKCAKLMQPLPPAKQIPVVILPEIVESLAEELETAELRGAEKSKR